MPLHASQGPGGPRLAVCSVGARDSSQAGERGSGEDLELEQTYNSEAAQPTLRIVIATPELSRQHIQPEAELSCLTSSLVCLYLFCSRWSHVCGSLVSACSLIWCRMPFSIWIRHISFSLYGRKTPFFVIRYEPGKFLDRDVGEMRDYFSITSQATTPFLSFAIQLTLLVALPQAAF